MKDKVCLYVLALVLAALVFSCEQGAGAEVGNGAEPGPEGPQIVGIKIIQPPDTTVYGREQTFSAGGLAVGWLYDDGSIVPMEDGEYAIAAEPDMARYIVHKVTVKAVSADYEDSFYIVVMNSDKVLQSITASYKADKTQALGLDFDKSGLTVTGTFSDGSKQNLAGYASIWDYNRQARGVQTLTAKVNGKSATFTITSRIGSDARASVNKITWMHENYQEKHYRPTRIKGEGFNPASANVKINVYPIPGSSSNPVALSYGPGGITDADLAPAIAAYKPDQIGAQSLPFTVDGRAFTIDLYVVDVAPDVWFDYGYMRHNGDTTGHGPGAGKYYAAPNETLVIAPVRYLIGYDADHRDTQASYIWTVSGSDSARAISSNGEFLTVTPKVSGTYTISVSVTGKSYLTGSDITKTAATELVCYASPLPAGTFVSPLKNFACGQFSEGGTGIGWSLGSAGGYEVWTVEHRPSYKIEGNPFGTWHEAGIVWMQEDRNGNGLPDEMWYELRGGDDDDAKWKNYITRRYAVTYIKGPGHGTINEYDQLIREVYWADSRGRSHIIPGGFPIYWGVSGDRVTYTCTLLRDDGNIATAQYGYGPMYDYVDAAADSFYVNKAMRADGVPVPVALSAVKFIKVQTAIFHYGGSFGDVSTEIKSADFLGVQTNFPSP